MEACRRTHLLSPAVAILVAVVWTAVAAAGTLTISADKNPATLGAKITFSFSPKVMEEEDHVTFDFGDGQQSTVAYSTYCALFGGCGTISHVFAGLGRFTVTAFGMVAGNAVNGSLEVIIAGGKDLYVLAAAHGPGVNQTVWRTDLEIHNYGSSVATYDIALLKRNTDNSSAETRTFEIAPGATVRHRDVLFTDFDFSGTAALQISPKTGAIMATSRTYNLSPNGTYGQFVPALPLEEAISRGETARLIQLSHDPLLQTGFRTNLGLVNPTPVAIDIEIAFFDSSGSALGTYALTLMPLEYKQLDKVFELVTSDLIEDGYVTVKTTSLGGIFFTYASVADNITGDPTLIPAQLSN
jgi:hypothetical protein